MMRRVVITGMGIYSCLGTSKDEVRDSLFAGKSGIIFDAQRKDIGFRSALTGMVEEPNLKGLLDRRQRKSMAQQCNYAFVSANEALEQAKIDADFLAKNEMGIIFGNDSSSKAVIDSVDGVRAKGDTTLLGSGSIFQAMKLYSYNEPVDYFQIEGNKHDIECSLCIRFSFSWYGICAH